MLDLQSTSVWPTTNYSLQIRTCTLSRVCAVDCAGVTEKLNFYITLYISHYYRSRVYSCTIYIDCAAGRGGFCTMRTSWHVSKPQA